VTESSSGNDGKLQPATLLFLFSIASFPSIEERSMNRVDRELIGAALDNNVPEVSRLLMVGADVNANDSLTPGRLLSRPATMVTVKIRPYGTYSELIHLLILTLVSVYMKS
jgi:hypothetical protein